MRNVSADRAIQVCMDVRSRATDAGESNKFMQFRVICLCPASFQEGLRLGTACVLKVHWMGGGRLDPVLALKESADACCGHKLGFAQLLLAGGNARNLTVASFNLNQISLGSVPLKLPN